MHYKNFKTVVYIPAAIAASLTEDRLASDYDFLERYIGLDKVYLETHRGDTDVSEEQLLMIKGFLEGKGVTVSGGITTIVPDFEGAEPGKRRLFDTFCYTDPAMRKKAREIAEYTAGIFDEVILDDFYFTNCTCERCIREKGDRDWVSFRRDLMTEVSRDLIVAPAKAVNPDVRMNVKYPNWRESYHFTGYLPKEQQAIFDATYIGTETRSPRYADQHLPEYLSYSLVRYIENAWPGRNGGGWFDTYQCWSADRYLEQGYLTAFAKAEELMFFQWSDLIDNHFVGGAAIQLKKLDEMIDGIGEPTGIPAYIPYGSSGENHLEMRLGMIGIPIDATPVFPSSGSTVLLTESSACDTGITEKLTEFVKAGNDAFITTGFLGRMQDELNGAGLTEARVTGRKLSVTRYQITEDRAGYIDGAAPIVFPETVHGNNAAWSLLNGGDGDYHTPLLLQSTYGKGRIFILSIPDNPSDIYRIPGLAADFVKRTLLPDMFASGSGFSMFTYDDGSMILYRYVKDDLRPAHVKIYTRKESDGLTDQITGEIIKAERISISGKWLEEEYYAADIILVPGVFRKLRWN